MLIKDPDDVKSSEITDESLYWNRRTFIRGAALAATVTATGLLYRKLATPNRQPRNAEVAESNATTGYVTPEGERANDFVDITNYNNFYEFSTSKEGVAPRAKNFVTRPWTVEVGGLAHKPKTFDIDDLIKLAPLEDRVYRFRCVEAWSMIIPWLGFPLKQLLAEVEPMGSAKYVAFTTLFDPRRMPNQNDDDVLPWPYVEGLRLDEAIHPLTILAAGLYGKMLLPQNGAPLRLVVPWKYGFKSIKSIVKITLTDRQPRATWNEVAPDEYGFYSNVNPEVSHPRWSQATERRIGEWGRRDTLMFNGYGDQVAQLYSGMDLKVNF
jgi:sulfoxide reductase catalytic subunit YedY